MMMIKIHIDNIDNEDGRVWAVQDGKEYHRVHEIRIHEIDLFTRESKRQPHAYLYGKGIVTVYETNGRVIALITGK